MRSTEIGAGAEDDVVSSGLLAVISRASVGVCTSREVHRTSGGRVTSVLSGLRSRITGLKVRLMNEPVKACLASFGRLADRRQTAG